MVARIVGLLALFQVGCHAPGITFDPFAIGRQTRVPPPPTHVVGNAHRRPYDTASRPSLNAGAKNGPGPNDQTDFEASAGVLPAANYAPTTPQRGVSLVGDLKLTENDGLAWRAPGTGLPGDRLAPLAPPQAEMPRLLPRTGPVAPLERRDRNALLALPPPRVHGWGGAMQSPAELGAPERTASRWQPRFDDGRR